MTVPLINVKKGNEQQKTKKTGHKEQVGNNGRRLEVIKEQKVFAWLGKEVQTPAPDLLEKQAPQAESNAEHGQDK